MKLYNVLAWCDLHTSFKFIQWLRCHTNGKLYGGVSIKVRINVFWWQWRPRTNLGHAFVVNCENTFFDPKRGG